MQNPNIPARKDHSITLVRQNRANLRANGLNGSELSMLEEIALLCNRGSTLRTLRGSYLAKCLGISPQWANALLRRLADVGLILRFKTGLVRLNLEKLNQFSVTLIKRARRKLPKPLKTLLEYGRRKYATLKRGDLYNQGEQTAEMFPGETQKEHLQALKTMYVPTELRKCKT